MYTCSYVMYVFSSFIVDKDEQKLIKVNLFTIYIYM